MIINSREILSIRNERKKHSIMSRNGSVTTSNKVVNRLASSVEKTSTFKVKLTKEDIDKSMRKAYFKGHAV